MTRTPDQCTCGVVETAKSGGRVWHTPECAAVTSKTQLVSSVTELRSRAAVWITDDEHAIGEELLARCALWAADEIERLTRENEDLITTVRYEQRRLVEALAERDKAIAANRPLATAWSEARDERDRLRAATTELLNVMEIQEKRHSGLFHLSAEAFMPMWDEAKRQARIALCGAADLQSEERAEVHRLTMERDEIQQAAIAGRNVRRREIEHYQAALQNIRDATGGNGKPFANKWARGVAEEALSGLPDEPSNAARV